MKYLERNIRYLLKDKPVEETIVFTNDPTLDKIKEAFDNDKVLFSNCSSREDTEMFRTLEKDIPEIWNHNVVLCYWYTISDEDFEKLITGHLKFEERNHLKWKKISWKAPEEYNKSI